MQPRLYDTILALNQDGITNSEYTLQAMPQIEVPIIFLKKDGKQTHPPKNYSNKKGNRYNS